MARTIDADELEKFPYSESAGTEEQIEEWVQEYGFYGEEAEKAKRLCWKVIEGFVNVVKTAPTLPQPNEPLTCYQPDGDGCAYQCYDGDDEPIDKCKECPLCYSDKQRHKPSNEPLTLEELREMDGKPVWCKWLLPEDRAIEQGKWFIVIFGDKAGLEIKRPAEYGCHFCKIDDYGKTWLAYRRPPEGEEDA